MNHSFDCGEQFMMAMKAWYFEKASNQGLGGEIEENSERGFQQLQQIMYSSTSPRKDNQAEYTLWNSSLCKILRTKEPREQKKLGREIKGFNPRVWDLVCIPVVTVASICRAEADIDLRKIYLEGGDRKFVEGSPKDTIWGIGMSWSDPNADDVTNWNGENRLGTCHDEAAAYIREVSISR